MSQPFEIPANFAVLRRPTDAHRPPSYQILFAQSINWGDCHCVENVGWVREDEVYPVIRQADRHIDPTIHTLRLRRHGWPNDTPLKFWKLPLYFMRNGAPIPVFDFQYTSWIPNGYTPIPMSEEGRDSLIRFVNDLKRLRCEQISVLDQPSQQVMTPPRIRPRSQTPPLAPERPRRGSFQQLEDDRIFAENVQRMLDAAEEPLPSSTFPPPPLEIPPFGDGDSIFLEPRWLQPPIPIRQALPLPKHVGDLILADARSGPNDCPIAATPFRQCQELSVTSCFHVFEKASLAYWMRDHDSCPVCRNHIVNVIHG